MEAGHLTVNVKLRIDQDLADELERLAKASDRTVAAEMRRGLRKHVADAKTAEAAEVSA